MKLPLLSSTSDLRPTRRELLQLIGAGTAWAMFPVGCAPKKTATPYQLKFLTADEATALGALADGILPPDQDPGGKALGTVEYVDRLLSAFEGGGPIYAGGPYSGRADFPGPDGSPSGHAPPNSFTTPLTLDRISAAHWKLTLYGSDGVPGGGPNDAITGQKVVGYRDQMRAGLKMAASQVARPLDQLSAEGIAGVLAGGNFDSDFLFLLVNLVAQAAFSAPEYGGNKNLAGWKIASFEGDRQPLGFSWFNTTTNAYQEDPKSPVSAPNPGTDANPIDATTASILDFIFKFPGEITHGQKFF